MKKFYILILFILFITQILLASGDGGYAGAFLRMGISARAKAMGDAFTAMPMGAVSAIYNPALLPHLQHRHAVLSSSILPLDRRLDFVGYAQPLQPKPRGEEDEGVPLKAGFSLAWVHAGVNDIDGRDLSGNHIGYFSNSEHAFYLSFSLSPIESFSIGLGGKVLYNRFPKLADDDKAVTSSGFGLDFGACFRPNADLTIGLAVRDQMSKYTWNTDKLWERGTSTTDKFPTVTRFGVLYRLPNPIFLIAADIEDCQEQDPRYHVGAEASVPNIGALRLGLDNGLLTMGFAVIIPGTKEALQLNYAFWNETNQAGIAHIFDLSASLPTRREIKPKPPTEYEEMLAIWQQREKQAIKSIAICDSAIADIKHEIKNTDQEIIEIQKQILSLVEADSLQISKFRSKWALVLHRLTELEQMSVIQLETQRNNIQKEINQIDSLKSLKICVLSEFWDMSNDVQARYRTILNKISPEIYEYIVRKGDNLWRIAQQKEFGGDGYQWWRIYSYNYNDLPDPNKLSIGLKLKVPKKIDPNFYIVQRDDYLSLIASKSEVYGDAKKWRNIYEANKKLIRDPNLIYPYQVLRIPK